MRMYMICCAIGGLLAAIVFGAVYLFGGSNDGSPTTTVTLECKNSQIHYQNTNIPDADGYRTEVWCTQ